MKLPLFQVDAFTGRVFGGNPAAVVLLERWLDDAVLQAIAAENNLSETAFFVGGDGRYRIRWLTPASEVDLCGHATLASGWVVFNRLEPGRGEVAFASNSGPLRVIAEGDRQARRSTSRVAARRAGGRALALRRRRLGGEPAALLASRDYLARVRKRGRGARRCGPTWRGSPRSTGWR